jgi:serine/threonine protein kinase
MTGISNSPPARSGPTVDTSRAQPRTDNELRAERETISQPRNVLVSGGGQALVNRQALLGTHRSFQAVMKQVDPTTARLQAPSSPMARAAAQALARPAPNLFERFAQAVSTAWHGYRADSAASSLAGQIKSGRFDAGSVDLLASLTRHAAQLDPAGATKASKHPAIALLQGKLAGAGPDALERVHNSPVFGALKAANAQKRVTSETMLNRLEALGFKDSAKPAAPATTTPASVAHAANRHLDGLQLILGHVLDPDTAPARATKTLTVDPDARATAAARIDGEVQAQWLATVKSEHALPTAYAAATALPASRLDNAKLAALEEQAKNQATEGSALDRLAAQARVKLHQAPSEPSADTVRQRTLGAEHIARDGLSSLLRGMDGPTRRQELLQLAQGEGWLARGALHLLGEGNRVQAWDVAGRPEAVIFNGQSYEFDKQLGNGAHGVALRYLPTGGGPGIVLKATTHDPKESELGLGVADRRLVGKVGKEFANHMHAMGDNMQGHPNLLAAKGIIVAQTPYETVRTSVDAFGTHVDEWFPPTHLADSVSLFTVMEEAGPGPEGLVKDINLLRLTGTISEATHGLMMRSLFAQMVEGCAHLEDRQIAHRDIKLENMLLSNDGRVLIMDLGEGDTGALLDPAPFAGSPLSMSPELLGRSRQAGKVDTWALGVVWRQMSNSRGEADPRDAAILNQRTNDGRILRDGDMLGQFDLPDTRTAWTQDRGNAVHRPAALNEALVSGRTLGNLDGVEQLTNAMLHPDQAQRPTLAALRNHHAIADPALQDPRLRELIEAIQFKGTAEIARLDQTLTALAGAAAG